MLAHTAVILAGSAVLLALIPIDPAIRGWAYLMLAVDAAVVTLAVATGLWPF